MSVVTKRQSFARLGSSPQAGKLRLKSGPRKSQLRALDHCYSGWNCAGERGLPFSSGYGNQLQIPTAAVVICLRTA